MTKETKRLPKSLHTVTAIVAVARLIKRQSATLSGIEIADDIAVTESLIALGYAGATDPDGLADKALAQMSPVKRVRKEA